LLQDGVRESAKKSDSAESSEAHTENTQSVPSSPNDPMSKLLDAMTLLQMRPMDLWKSLDFDHDNKVPNTELKSGLQRLGCAALADVDIERLLLRFDADGDRNISIQEWKAAVTESYHLRHHQQRAKHAATVEAGKTKATERASPAGVNKERAKRVLTFR
jgi:hypothetical protein